MALPKLTTPTYELEIPSTDEKIKYRPFLVKEEKILMMALESKSSGDITQAVKDIVSECTFNKVNIDLMPMFDVEYIFLNIRSKSVGEVSKLRILCPDDKKTYAELELDLNEVNVQVGEDHTNKIELGNGMGMIMKYPSIDSFKDSGIRDINASNMLEVISTCILQIYEDEGKKVYDSKDQIIDKQFFRLRGELNYNKTTEEYEITELMSSIDIFINSKISVSSITLGFVKIK